MSYSPTLPIQQNSCALWSIPTLDVQLETSFWYAVHTASRHEKQVGIHLAQKSLENFVPLYGSVRQWRSGRAFVEFPLFPGYVFTKIALKDRVRVLEVPGVVSLVGFRNRPIPLAEQEIHWLRSGLKSSSAQPHPYLKVGEKVRIKRGLLAGAQGILVRHKQDYRVVLSVELIMRSVSIEVNAEDLELIRTIS